MRPLISLQTACDNLILKRLVPCVFRIHYMSPSIKCIKKHHVTINRTHQQKCNLITLEVTQVTLLLTFSLSNSNITKYG